MRRGVGGLIIVGAVAAAVVAVGAAALVTPDPPSTAVAAQTAGRLEGLIPLLDELGVAGWEDSGSCHYLWLENGERRQDPADGCGDGSAFTEADDAAWSRIARAAAGTVPGGRLMEAHILQADVDPSLGPGRHVLFIGVPRSLLGQDAIFARWFWRWSEADAAADPRGMPPHWTFWAQDEAVV